MLVQQLIRSLQVHQVHHRCTLSAPTPLVRQANALQVTCGASVVNTTYLCGKHLLYKYTCGRRVHLCAHIYLHKWTCEAISFPTSDLAQIVNPHKSYRAKYHMCAWVYSPTSSLVQQLLSPQVHMRIKLESHRLSLRIKRTHTSNNSPKLHLAHSGESLQVHNVRLIWLNEWAI